MTAISTWSSNASCRPSQQADSQASLPVTAAYGTAEDESLLGDSRLPIVKDGVLRVVRFDKQPAAIARRV